jgi:hypothetical protein
MRCVRQPAVGERLEGGAAQDGVCAAEWHRVHRVLKQHSLVGPPTVQSEQRASAHGGTSRQTKNAESAMKRKTTRPPTRLAVSCNVRTRAGVRRSRASAVVAAVRAGQCAKWALAVVLSAAERQHRLNGLVCLFPSGVSPILGTDGPAPAGRSFLVQPRRSYCTINSWAVLRCAPHRTAVLLRANANGNGHRATHCGTRV